jgi:chitin disaccharide deacetylase
MKKIILCADDYAQSAAISSGILQLVEQRRLSAVSCFSEAEFWTRTENSLFDYRDRVDIGLHFNLTQPFPAATVATQPLGAVMRSALSGGINRNQIVQALNAQLDCFESVAGQAPDFVDGHQHVHILPGIRDIVVVELAQRYRQRKPYLRAVNPRLPGHGGLIKLMVLKLLGRGFDDLAQRHGLRTNRGFAGIYSLQPDADFAALMRKWINTARSGDLLMCHPGAAASDINDPIAATRPHELALFRSAEFDDLLARNAICLSRFCDLDL